MNPAYATVDHVFDVPLDHSSPGGPRIEVFAREVADPARAGEPLPWLLYLQGGPGGKSPRPSAGSPGWLDHALKTHRVLLLDQRGTGRSTPVTARTAARCADPGRARRVPGPLPGGLDSRGRRADTPRPVRRRALGDARPELRRLPHPHLPLPGAGGAAVLLCGGRPARTERDRRRGLRPHLPPRVRDRVLEFYDRYPDDAPRLRRIADLLGAGDVRLPDGDRLTVRRLRALGLALGMGDGFERLHWLLDEALDADGEPSDVFLHQTANLTGFRENPLYAVLQETIYGQGGAPTAWAASRAMADLPEFADDADPLMLTGEMIYPWMFRDIAGLRPFAEAAELLAHSDAWQPLYDPRRLAANRVPVAAVVYHDDMYVDAGLSLRTAREVGAVRTWVTNEWEHDGIGASGGRVLARLMDMAAGRA
ncbi:alpha/beta fold hydrolase [Streptomyces olivoverticillatus]